MMVKLLEDASIKKKLTFMIWPIIIFFDAIAFIFSHWKCIQYCTSKPML